MESGYSRSMQAKPLTNTNGESLNPFGTDKIVVVMLLYHTALTAFSNISLLAHSLCPASPRTKKPSSFLCGDVMSAPEDFMISLMEHPSFPMT